MIVIVGPSASGKTEISKILLNDYKYKKCVTSTTRLKRQNEIADIDYHFLTKEEFKNLIENNLLVEYTIYQNNYYGIQKKDIELNKVVVVEPGGANILIDEYKDKAFVVYISSSERDRKIRMINRGDDIESIKNRLLYDREVFSLKKMKKVDLFIVNNGEDLNKLAMLINEKYKKNKNKF